jgi:hypothetical protein
MQTHQGSLFNFHLLFYYMTETPSSTSTLITFFNLNPRRQLHPLSPSTSILIANFVPRRQLQPSSLSTSTLVAFQSPNPVAFLFEGPIRRPERGGVNGSR